MSESNPNVLFIVIDTCRASTFDSLVKEGKVPHLKSLIDNAVMYENATAAGPWTVPSHGSMFTGLYPSQHGTSANDPSFDPPNTPIAQEFREEGYYTVGISANPWISPGFNFDKGFDQFKTANDLFWGGTEVEDLANLSSRQKQIHKLLERVTPASSVKTIFNIAYEKLLAKRFDSGAKKITSDALKIIRNQKEDPLFLFLNYMEPHLDYEPPEDIAREELPDGVKLREARKINQNPWEYIAGTESMKAKDFEILHQLYRAEIRYLDTQLGRLFEELREREEMNDTCIIVAGDHGENIGDHSLMDHQYCLYQTLVHVPLAIQYPNMTNSDKVSKPVETKNIYGTLCDIANLDNTEEENSLLNDENQNNQIISEYPEPQPSMSALEERVKKTNDNFQEYDRCLRAIRIGSWKYIEGTDGHTELYNLEKDPAESDPVDNSEQAKKLRDHLISELGELKEKKGKRINVGKSTERRLDDLGYI